MQKSRPKKLRKNVPTPKLRSKKRKRNEKKREKRNMAIS